MAYSLRRREKEFHKFFRDIPEDEILLRDYSCAYSKDMMLCHGRLYMSVNWLCFHVNMLGPKHQVTIRLDEISAVSKQKTALVIPNAIEITVGKRKYFFTTFNNRNHAFNDCLRIWQNAIQGKTSNQTELLVELSSKVSLDTPLLEEPKKSSTSGESSDTDIAATTDVVYREAVPHFALDVAGKALPNGEVTVGNSEHHEVDRRAESDIDQEYTDAYDSSEVLRKMPISDSRGFPLHDTNTTITTSEDSCTGSELGAETGSTSVEENGRTPLQPYPMVGRTTAGSSVNCTGLSSMMRLCKMLHWLLRPVALFNLLMILLALILVITTATLMCHLSRVDQFINTMFPWQPWCSYICLNHFLMSPFDLSSTATPSI